MEKKRLEENKKHIKHWEKWGPYLSARQWGTVREDYGSEGNPWTYLPFEEASKRAYRWGEDGIGGISDNHQRLCFALSLWNEKDCRLKERFYGLSNPQGNHGEDVKEAYYYLDNMPTHSYMKMLYKYPQSAFPYERLLEENEKRSQMDAEFELIETGIFDESRYFDVFIEYAKVDAEDLFIRFTVYNRGPEKAPLHLLPTLWARNTWSWKEGEKKPRLIFRDGYIASEIASLGTYSLYCDRECEVLFTDNETANGENFAKDGIEQSVVHGKKEAVNLKRVGTKAAYHIVEEIPAGEHVTLHLRLTKDVQLKKPFNGAENLFNKRIKETELFYKEVTPKGCPSEEHRILRQALAGMLWNKQYYHFVVEEWLEKTQNENPPNQSWVHFYNDDVVSVPDKWEYPTFFAWDMSFHALPLAVVDPEFAKDQLTLLTREWFMHPNGQLPAYEWNFNDVNPPVHAWASWRVYKISGKNEGFHDDLFLERIFQKLLMNFTWWVNRKDSDGRNIFQGGFLGLDNISVFNRSEDLPLGSTLYQSDATSWMAMYSLNMLAIALELAQKNSAYEDMASKFYEHFLYIADAINYTESGTTPLWNEEDGFYYDVLMMPDGSEMPIKVRSIVGLLPLLAVMTIEQNVIDKLPGFKKRMEWFIHHRQDLCEKLACMRTPGIEGRHIMAILDRDKLKKLLNVMLNENEFLSPFGIRSMSICHLDHPYKLKLDDHEYSVDYEPGDSATRLFGGNSNWRGPIWFPLNILIIESLQKFHHYHGDHFKVEFPTGSDNLMNLWDISLELSRRLLKLFLFDENGNRPCNRFEILNRDPHFKDHVLFHEYFHADKGWGLGAAHQTGWTGLVAKLIRQLAEYKN